MAAGCVACRSGNAARPGRRSSIWPQLWPAAWTVWARQLRIAKDYTDNGGDVLIGTAGPITDTVPPVSVSDGGFNLLDPQEPKCLVGDDCSVPEFPAFVETDEWPLLASSATAAGSGPVK